jgi:itaconate CoA-transferase
MNELINALGPRSSARAGNCPLPCKTAKGAGLESPPTYAEAYAMRQKSAAEAVAGIDDGETLVVGMAVGQPPALLDAVAERIRANDLNHLKVYYKLAMQPLGQSLLIDEVIEKIDAHSFFIAGPDHRIEAIQERTHQKHLSFVPVNFSQIPRLFGEHIPVDTVLVTVSPMDKAGYFSLGTNNDFVSIAARACRRLIVEVNQNMPRVFGQSQIHISEVTALVQHDAPLPVVATIEPTPEARAIGAFIAPLVPNGATIQLGVGKIPSGVAEALVSHEDLGIHTELFSPAFVKLIRAGAATGRRKALHRHKHVFTVAIGDADMYEFMDDNSALESYPSSYVNDVRVIAQNNDLVSINTAIAVDLYGQVNAEFIGEHQYSGSGGQFDFVKGASLAAGGKSVIALQSTARHGTVSTIVPSVHMVTDDRMDVEYVVTEYGIVNLRGRSTKGRAEALISIAHPDHREELRAAARKITLI